MTSLEAVEGWTIFNIKGNAYRLVVKIEYGLQIISTLRQARDEQRAYQDSSTTLSRIAKRVYVKAFACAISFLDLVLFEAAQFEKSERERDNRDVANYVAVLQYALARCGDIPIGKRTPGPGRRRMGGCQR